MEATVFISIIIVALTQLVKMAVPQAVGWVTIIVAFFVGIMVSLFSGVLGLEAVSLAEGIVAALGAIGISTLAGKAGGGTAGDSRG